jgi:hypothetical protein
MARRPIVDLAHGAIIEYRVQRNALVRQVHEGQKMVEDLCDAHFNLIRAAKGVGRLMGELCPVCSKEELRQVVYVFGDKLSASGVCPISKADLRRLERRELPVTCYAVEVCVGCKFNHLLRKWHAGGQVEQRPKVAK